MHAVLFRRYPEFHQLPVTDKWFVEIDEQFITFNSTFSAVGEGESTIDLKGLEPDFNKVLFPPDYSERGIDSNDSNECLIPVWTSTNKLFFYRFKVHEKSGDPGRIAVDDTTKIDLPLLGSVRAVFGNKDYFLVGINSNENGLFKIYPDGSSKQVLDKLVVNIFRIDNNRLFAAGVNNPATIYISNDDGETWKRFESVPYTIFDGHYSMIGDSVVGFATGSQLFTLKLRDNGDCTLRALKNDGLESNEITSVVAFKDSVYVTSYTGVFTRSVNAFFDTKKTTGTE